MSRMTVYKEKEEKEKSQLIRVKIREGSSN